MLGVFQHFDRGLLREHRIGCDVGRDGQNRLCRIRVGIDRNSLGLSVFLTLGIELDLDASSRTRSNGFGRTFGHGASAAAFALGQQQRLRACVGELEDVRCNISFIHRSKVVLIFRESHRSCRGSGRCSYLARWIHGLVWSGGLCRSSSLCW